MARTVPGRGGGRYMHVLCQINSGQLTEFITILVLLLITAATLRDGLADTERPQRGSINMKPQVVRPSALPRLRIIRQMPTCTDKLVCYIKQSSDWTPLQRQSEINRTKGEMDIQNGLARASAAIHICRLNTALTLHNISLSDCLVILQ
jgi:hypothetical protein